MYSIADIDPRVLQIAAKEMDPKLRILNDHYKKQILHLRVSSIEACNLLPGVTIKNSAGPDAAGHYYATVETTSVRTILESPDVVLAVEAPIKFRCMNKKVDGSKMTPSPNMKESVSDLLGNGAVIGIIDSGGIDYRMSNFRKQDGTTRLLGIYNQFASDSKSNRKFSPQEINKSIEAGMLLKGYSVGFSEPESNILSSHATAVADCAAGGGPEKHGVAPNADILYVDLHHDLKEDNYWSDTGYLVDAIDYIFKTVGERPCVINLSQGTLDGPPNGLSPAISQINTMCSSVSNRAIVISAGNYGDELMHATVQTKPGSTNFLEFRVWPYKKGAKEKRFSELNAWCPIDSVFEFHVETPDGQLYGPFNLGEDISEAAANDFPFNYAYSSRADSMLNQFYVQPLDDAQSGIWKIKIASSAANPVGEIHAYLSKEDSAETPRFESSNAARNCTLVSLSNMTNAISVGAYDNIAGGSRTAASFSSLGPSIDGRQKPDIAAPGVHVEVIQPLKMPTLKNHYVYTNGTSFAAPVVSGIIALCLAEVAACGGKISLEQVRQILIDAADPLPNSIEWDARLGFGYANAKRSVSLAVKRFGQIYDGSARMS